MTVDHPTTSRGRSFDVLASAADRDAWLAARLTGISASDVAAIFGASPWTSAYTLYRMKRGDINEAPSSERMEWGLRLENAIADAFADKTSRKIWKGIGGSLCRSRMYPWLLATPDFEQQDPDATKPGLLEIKTTGAGSEDWNDSVPVHHQIQVQQQLLVCARPYASVACLIGGQSFRYQHTTRHEAFLQTLVTKTKAFWDMVQAGTPPEVDASPSTFETLKQLREDGRAVDLPPMVLAWHDGMMVAREKRLALEKEEAEYERLIGSTLGTAALGVLPHGRGTYKFVTVSGHEVAGYAVAPHRQLKFCKRIAP